MANEKNLVSLADRPPEERRKIARMGGVASGIARREKAKLSRRAKITMAWAVIADAYDEFGDELFGDIDSELDALLNE